MLWSIPEIGRFPFFAYVTNAAIKSNKTKIIIKDAACRVIEKPQSVNASVLKVSEKLQL